MTMFGALIMTMFGVRRRRCCVVLWLVCVISDLPRIYGSSTTSASNPYESVRTLDSSGQAVQLKHAQAAADIQGRLIVALRRPLGVVWIVCAKKRKDNYDSHLRNTDDKQQQQQQLVHAITRKPVEIQPGRQQQYNYKNANTYSNMYAVCTGVQADATWLIQRLRQYAKRVEERYDSHYPLAGATAVATMKRKFWGYTEKEAWKGPCIDVDENDNWARPMGIRTILITFLPPPPQEEDNDSEELTQQQQQKQQGPLIHLIEPSGIIREIDQFGCMGKNSQLIQAALDKKLIHDALGDFNQCADDADLESILLETISEVLGIEASDVELVIESISPVKGIERRTVTLADDLRNRALNLQE